MSHVTEKILHLKKRCGRSSVPEGWLCDAVAYNLDGTRAWEQTVVLPDEVQWTGVNTPTFNYGAGRSSVRAMKIDWLVIHDRCIQALVSEEQDQSLHVRATIRKIVAETRVPEPLPTEAVAQPPAQPQPEEQENRWRVESFSDSDGRTGYQIMTGDDVLVDMQHGNGWKDAQMRSTLAMMAAAPQMLEALEDAVSAGFCECCCGETPCCGSCTATLMEEAIKAAVRLPKKLELDDEKPAYKQLTELRPSQLKQLSSTALLDRFHDLKKQFEDTMNELTNRWLSAEEKERLRERAT